MRHQWPLPGALLFDLSMTWLFLNKHFLKSNLDFLLILSHTPTQMAFFPFFKKMANPGLFSFIFGLFKQTLQIFTTNRYEKCPSIIWC